MTLIDMIHIYKVLLKTYKRDLYWINWDLGVKQNHLGWIHGSYFEIIRLDYGRILEKYWNYKK